MNSFASKVSKHANCSAKGAEYESQGQARSASSLEDNQNLIPALKGRNTCVFRPFRPRTRGLVITRGDALRFASRLPLAFKSRAVGALRQSHNEQ